MMQCLGQTAASLSPLSSAYSWLVGLLRGNFFLSFFFSFLDQALGYDMQDINHSFPGGSAPPKNSVHEGRSVPE